MIVYVDTSALLKRVVVEQHAAALEQALGRWHDTGAILGSSALTAVETSRALRTRLDGGPSPAEVAEAIEVALSGVAQHPVDAEVIALARRIGPPVLRSLDAIHLATAILLDVDLLCGYDERMNEVAEGLGIITVSPRA